MHKPNALERVLSRALSNNLYWEDFRKEALPNVMKLNRNRIASCAVYMKLPWHPPVCGGRSYGYYDHTADVMRLLKEYWRREA